MNIYRHEGTLDVAEVVARYAKARQQRTVITGRQSEFASLIAEFGKRAFGNWQIAFILVAFGVLVGPVNLFVFAKAGRRHRLFFTTPLISLGASVLLVLLILFQDGTGGRGSRHVLVNLESGDTAAYLTQFQASRTGVLFSSAFEAPNTYAAQAALGASPWSAVSIGGSESLRYSLDDDVFGGDWFQSRREHGHLLQTVRPTRARIELKGRIGESKAPTIVSSLGFNLDELYFKDATGLLWKSAGVVKTGQRVTLQAIEGPEMHPFLTANTLWINRQLLGEPGHFVASAKEAPGLTIQTHKSIDWADRVLIFGPVAGGE